MDLNHNARIQFDGQELHQALAALLESFLFPPGTEQHRQGTYVSPEYEEEFTRRFSVSIGKLVDLLSQQYAIGKANDMVYPEEILWQAIVERIQARESEIQKNYYDQIIRDADVSFDPS